MKKHDLINQQLQCENELKKQETPEHIDMSFKAMLERFYKSHQDIFLMPENYTENQLNQPKQ